MNNKTKTVDKLVSKITFYLSFLCLLLFTTLASIDKTELALVCLYLMLVFWGANKIDAYVNGMEIRLTFAVKIADNAPKPLRIIALIFTIFVALYGALELWKLSF